MQQLIEKGCVLLNGQPVTKASADVKPDDVIRITEAFRFASIGGDKLEKAFCDFPSCSVEGKICADIGASNGGFTDCLLKRGARRVYAIDVGECALSQALRLNPKVIVKDRTNARYLTAQSLGETCDFVCSDVSFISLKLILPSIAAILQEGGEAIVLVKPQFEVGSKYLNKKGIVTDEKIRRKALDDVCAFCASVGLEVVGRTTAPIRAEKNTEFLIYLKKCIE